MSAPGDAFFQGITRLRKFQYTISTQAENVLRQHSITPLHALVAQVSDCPGNNSAARVFGFEDHTVLVTMSPVFRESPLGM